jgi:hypothetical protein
MSRFKAFAFLPVIAPNQHCITSQFTSSIWMKIRLVLEALLPGFSAISLWKG